MEKFGIFDLLDTLSALVEQESGSLEKPPQEKTVPKAQDAAFAPPAYGTEQTAPQQGQGSAISSLLDRHDALSRKIDGKK